LIAHLLGKKEVWRLVMAQAGKLSIGKMAAGSAIVALGGALALASGAAWAATQGSLGGTSTGTSTITATIPSLGRVSGIADLALGSFDGVTDMDGSDDVCVYSNVGTGTYAVTMTSANASGGVFRLTDGSNFASYNAFWNDAAGTAGRISVTSGAQLTTQTGANTVNSVCASGPANTGNFSVNVPAANLTGVPAGSYTDTITILITPQ
jgi:hypothetical protein